MRSNQSRRPNISDNNVYAGIGIRGRLLAGFIVVALTFLVTCFIAIYYISNIHNLTDKFYKVDLPFSHLLSDLEGNIIDVQMSLQEIVIFHNKGLSDDFKSAWSVLDAKIETINNKTSRITDKNVLDKWVSIKKSLQELRANQHNAIESSYSGDDKKAMLIYRESIYPEYNALVKMMNDDIATNASATGIIDEMSGSISSEVKLINNNLKDLILVIIITFIVCLSLSIIIAIWTANKILTPVYYAIEIAKDIASGNRDIDVKIISSDETASLLHSLDKMQESIKESEQNLEKKAAENKALFDSIVKSASEFSKQTSRVAAGDLTKRLSINTDDNNQIMVALGNDLNQMTDNLSTISSEITKACINMVSTLDEVRHSVDTQSSGATEQASSINEITASISEIEKSAAQTMDKAKSLGEVATKTRDKGQKGLEAVEQSIIGMKSVRDKVETIAETILDLSKQTQQVGEITIVVNNLAQQSKMLALNASIEAAKAGESGKGFAVVANEVKNLAEQSEQSTVQVQKILEDIKMATEKAVMVTEEGTKGVDTGMNLIEQTGSAIRSLNDVIYETTIATQQIEAAIRQEASGIEQINAGMNEINQVTASFVESVRETTEAMNNLSKIAQSLKVSIDTYKV